MEVPRLGVRLELQLRPMPQSQQHQIQAVSVINATAYGNTRSLTHWARLGIELTTSQRLHQVLNSLSHKGNSWFTFDSISD